MYRDLENAIRICHNPIQRSKAKHIALRYHFIKYCVEDGNIKVHFVHSEDQFVDIFNKALPETTFNRFYMGLV